MTLIAIFAPRPQLIVVITAYRTIMLELITTAPFVALLLQVVPIVILATQLSIVLPAQVDIIPLQPPVALPAQPVKPTASTATPEVLDLFGASIARVPTISQIIPQECALSVVWESLTVWSVYKTTLNQIILVVSIVLQDSTLPWAKPAV